MIKIECRNCQISIKIEIGMNSVVSLPNIAEIDVLAMDMNGKVFMRELEEV